MNPDNPHMCMRLEYPKGTPEQWDKDKAYMNECIAEMNDTQLDGLIDLLDCGMCWTGDGKHDGDIDDMCEAICAWYDTLFRPYLRQLCRIELAQAGVGLNWKAFEVYIHESHEVNDDNLAGTMRAFADIIDTHR